MERQPLCLWSWLGIRMPFWTRRLLDEPKRYTRCTSTNWGCTLREPWFTKAHSYRKACLHRVATDGQMKEFVLDDYSPHLTFDRQSEFSRCIPSAPAPGMHSHVAG